MTKTAIKMATSRLVLVPVSHDNLGNAMTKPVSSLS